MCLTPIKDCNIAMTAREVSDTFMDYNEFINGIIPFIKITQA